MSGATGKGEAYNVGAKTKDGTSEDRSYAEAKAKVHADAEIAALEAKVQKLTDHLNGAIAALAAAKIARGEQED